MPEKLPPQLAPLSLQQREIIGHGVDHVHYKDAEISGAKYGEIHIREPAILISVMLLVLSSILSGMDSDTSWPLMSLYWYPNLRLALQGCGSHS